MPALLVLLLTFGIACLRSTQEVDAFSIFAAVPPSSCGFQPATPRGGTRFSYILGRRTTTTTKYSSLHAITSLNVATSSGIVSVGFTLGDTTLAVAPALSLDAGVLILGCVVLTVAVVCTVAQVLLVDHDKAQTSGEDTIKAVKEKMAMLSSSFSTQQRFRSSSPRHNDGLVGRRGTLTKLIGGAIGFAASDMILGSAGKILLGVGGGGTTTTTTAAIMSSSSSSVYGAQWNALFQRIAAASAKHGEAAAIASPELVAWISKSPAVLANPELRAWIAAQHAFRKGRQVVALTAAVVVEEGGMAAATATVATRAVATAATAVAKKQNYDTEDSVDDDVGDLGTLLLNSTAASTIDTRGIVSTTSFKLKSDDDDSDLSFPPTTLVSASTCTDKAVQSESGMTLSDNNKEKTEKAYAAAAIIMQDDEKEF
jgi:hypothetical protein